MSRIGKKPISIPKNVEVKVESDNTVIVKGPKGMLSYKFHPNMKIKVEDGQIIVERPNDESFNRALHGTTRALLNNMVKGVTEGFTEELEIVGIGYRGAVKGKTLELTLGYSHPVIYEIPEGIQITMEGTNIIKVSGIDKQKVGQVAAKIRSFREPDPYKGKGIRYKGEVIKLKAGKTVGKK
ncbi:ribosomal protein L6 [Sulfurihydrogenibium azorense Az-Fu1]|jgi:large subunit ribosomal protein L6|uniref:Large ribosomal subunit protein uL6 n=1 Tax=Sulfurihydrogenibium azorense (strain DSM 15241 / OCM 825 / Az-Fu1) TaxID=204536 RepID=C1DX60_SULAA|nr:50S ribosomal protein L6 [Sulfurihydrogenibium azorense]ACN98224.1 ribosomal protein L6 [Sulfurihydrogenibium azorense Az-Fu1]